MNRWTDGLSELEKFWVYVFIGPFVISYYVMKYTLILAFLPFYLIYKLHQRHAQARALEQARMDYYWTHGWY